MSASDSTAAPVNQRLFWGCFIALVTTAFGFVVRALCIDDWATSYNWTETQKGVILAVGFWPFALSIFFFSLFIDRLGYGRAAFVGFVLHIVSIGLLLVADSFNEFFIGTFLFSLAAGTVEAYINPVVATMYAHNKAKWLNILHAGWPGGSVLAGLIIIAIADTDWRVKLGLTFIPVAAYALMLLGCRFPVSERVAAGVSYRDMLRDFGGLGATIVTYLIAIQIGEILRNFGVFSDLSLEWQQRLETQDFVLYALVPAVVVGILFGLFVGSAGRPLFFILCLIMIPLATTELGVDSWISDLLKPELQSLKLNAGWILVYTMAIMTVLRFSAGPIVHRLSPIGLLVVCAALAAVGLVFFSRATGWAIFAAATIYGVGKTFFWPTMLAIVSERFPRGGALTLNAVAAVGMLGLSVGGVFLGNIQDRAVTASVIQSDSEEGTKLGQFLTDERTSFLGTYRALDGEKEAAADATQKEQLATIKANAKKGALFTTALFPLLMLVAYLAIWLYFASSGGYRAETLARKH